MVKKSSTMSARKPVEAGLYDGDGAKLGGEGEWSDADADGNETWHDARDNTSRSPIKDLHNNQHQSPIANMGNSESAEERSAWIRSTAADMRKENGGAEPSSTGKLTRPSTRTRSHNPPYQNPVAAVHSAQIQLAPKTAIRTSTYDFDEDAPASLNASRAQRTDSAPDISPRKADKKKAKRAQKAVVEITAGADEAEHVAENAAQGRTTRDSRWSKASWEKQATHEREQEEETDAGADEEDGDDNIMVADQEVDVTEEHGTPAKNTRSHDPPRRPGRPRKKSRNPRRPAKTSNNAAEVRPTRWAPIATPAGVLPEPAQPTFVQNGLRRSARAATAQGSGTAGPVDNRSTFQIMMRGSGKESEVLKLKKRYEKANGESQSAVGGEQPVEAVDEDGNGEENAEDDGENNGEADDDLFVTDSTRRPLAVQQADLVRPSEMDFEGPDEEDDDDSTLPVIPAGSRKRKADAQAARPNTKKKRSPHTAFTHSDGTGAVEESDFSMRLFGQRSAFIEVLDKSDQIGRPVRDGVPDHRQDIDNRDPLVKAAVELCASAIQRYTTLRNHDGPVEQDHDPLDVLNELSSRVDGLRGKNKDFPTKWTKKGRAKEIYYHLVRKLVDLVKAAIVCYEALDTDAEGQDQMTMPHLRTVVRLIVLILNLIESAKNYIVRPDPSDHVVQPVNEMKPPLRDIHLALMREIQNYELSQRTQRRQEQDRRDRIAQEQEDIRRAQEEAHTKNVREKWQKLHMERMLIEGGLMRAAKRAHLAIPDEYHVEHDHNGIPFEREEIFHPRVGPPPDLVEAALNQHWSLVELSTLSDGLKVYTGEHLFERTFRRFCGPGRELNKFNVTEIVVKAVQVKKALTEDQQKKYGDVDKWVLDIPTWMRGQHGEEGQENMDGVEVMDVDEGDLTMSGGNGEA